SVPNLVHRDHLAFAIAGSSTVTKVAQLCGTFAGGVLVATHTFAVYGICAGFFLFGCFAVLSIRRSMRIVRPEPFSLDLLFGGFRFIGKTPTVFAAISIDLVVVLFGGVTGLLPVFAVDILEVDSAALGLMRGMPALGALVVGLYLSAHRLPWAVGRSFYVSLVVFSASILLFGLTRSYWISLVALVAYGASDMVSVYIRQALIQLGTPDALRGRVSSVNSVMVISSNQLGDFRAGMMAGVIGAPAAVVLGGGVTLAATVLWAKIFPQLGRIKSI
ncbi:MAG: MFS transporter, partial [Gemmobacter sp.]